ncbi:MAG: cyclase family protein [Alphaproteobacteria bacterium]|jgi:kynurenine formamidase|nr:cyclase family protein [Alphaproteobacteria bacterium]
MTNCIHDHGRWGRGDQFGAGHLLTAERTLAALGSVNEGKIYEMSHVIEMGAPRIEPSQLPYVITSSVTSKNNIRYRQSLGATNEAGANLERIEMTVHVGTHIDALGHFSDGDRLHGGYSVDETVGDWGLLNLGIEQAPPIITRGLCVDVSGLDGGEYLEAGRAVTQDDLARAFDAAGVAPQAGDVICIQTGWGRHFMKDNAKYVAGEPGIDLATAEWLTGQDVVAIGVDNMAVEVLPGTNHPEIMMPVHQHCLVDAGVYLIENLVMDALVADGVASFCFILLPVKFKGATGSPVRPVALV